MTRQKKDYHVICAAICAQTDTSWFSRTISGFSEEFWNLQNFQDLARIDAQYTHSVNN